MPANTFQNKLRASLKRGSIGDLPESVSVGTRNLKNTSKVRGSGKQPFDMEAGGDSQSQRGSRQLGGGPALVLLLIVCVTCQLCNLLMSQLQSSAFFLC